MTTFYAWAVPSPWEHSPLDHTWVTTYDNRVNKYPDEAAVVAAGEDYWFCWGVFHGWGGTPDYADGLIASQPGDLARAKCIASANDAHAHGAVFVYGVTGVCHQLTNEVLYATGAAGSPVTVKHAGGWALSHFIYGTYGLAHAAWSSRLGTCVAQSRQLKGLLRAPGLPDTFADHAAVKLNDTPDLLARLLAFRGEVQQYAALPMPGFAPPSAETLNQRNQHFLDQAADMLGPERYQALFGVEARQRVDLVDPTIVEALGPTG